MSRAPEPRREPWIFRVLVLAYPRSFRRRYGDALMDAYRKELKAGRGRGGGRMAFWAWILADTAHSALVERVGGWRRQRRPLRGDLPPSPLNNLSEMIHDLIRDVRFGFRSLRQSPSFTITALLILSLGIGATAVVFTVADSVFLTAPPHVRDPSRLVRLTRTSEDSRSVDLSYPDYLVFAERSRSFAGLLAYDPSGVAVTIERGRERMSARAWHVSANYFDVLGVPMALGGGFVDEDDDVIRERAVAVISDTFWRTVLGSDPRVVGTTLIANGTPLVVVGVAPAGFRGVSPVERSPDLWVPVTLQPVLSGREDDDFLILVENQTITWLDVIGRLAPETTIERAGAEVGAINDYLVENFGEWQEDQGSHLSRTFMFLPNEHVEMLRFTRLLGLVVATVLLIVCANIAILQLARSCSRRHEFDVRAALGASRPRLVRQLLTEALLLSAGGVVGGYLIAWLGASTLGSLIPMDIAVEFVPDASVLAFAAAMGVISAVAFGLNPALWLSRLAPAAALRARGTTGGRSTLRSGLVVVQVAASLVLVTGAALFVRSLLSAEAVDPGFARDGRVFLSTNLASHGYSDETSLGLLDETLARIRSLPGVEAASVAFRRPFRGSWSATINPREDEDPDAEGVRVFMNVVGDDYFRTMDIDLLEGRAFEPGDLSGSDGVLIVNRAAAEALWPGQAAIGQTLGFMDDLDDRVIGVVENTDYRSLGEDPLPVLYAALRQYANPRVVFIVATFEASAQIIPRVREAILAVDPDIAFSGITTVEGVIDDQLGTYRLGARAVGLFGALGALIAAIGIYGVLSFSVASQRREIGIRMALGDTRWGTVGRVVSHGLRMAAVGVVIGLAAALASARLIAGMLFGIDPHDAVSFMVVPLIIVSIAAAASWLPARRAATVEPAEALRIE